MDNHLVEPENVEQQEAFGQLTYAEREEQWLQKEPFFSYTYCHFLIFAASVLSGTLLVSKSFLATAMSAV